ncbi:hypothetical protein FB00_12180 [Cellulosimicrobium funkei]|uniref:DUF6318 domain-containing protein n=1 Tax=Cellulosimicrobium funkei TaxID=264251 RepID=A0A0H2KLP0_9MICO|nr:DUF6318 family protein [Cellulosimicrobium funkei]KLN34445.1 hypothetical protein FB00_12180 [Cellulosimicrobium funkei]
MGAVVAVGSVVAGCTGGGDPGPSPTVEEPVVTSPSETPEPTPTETGPAKPERPAAMERDDVEGAAAAAEYFLELYPYVMATGDTVEWDAMTWTETCTFCTSVSQDAATVQDQAETFTGAQISVSNPDVGAFDDFLGGYPIIFDFEQTPHRRVAQDGTVVSEDDGDAGRLQIDVLNREGAWLVLAVGDAE